MKMSMGHFLYVLVATAPPTSLVLLDTNAENHSKFPFPVVNVTKFVEMLAALRGILVQSMQTAGTGCPLVYQRYLHQLAARHLMLVSLVMFVVKFLKVRGI